MSGGVLAFLGLWAIPYLRDIHGLERSAAATYTTIGLLAFAVSTLLAGWLSDRLGRRKPVVIASTLLYTGACLGLAYLPWNPGPTGIALFVLLGFSPGGFIILYASAKEMIAPAVSGMAIALVNTGAFLGAALIQPLFGWIMDLSWNGTVVNGVRVYTVTDYHLGFLLMLGCAALAMVAATRIRETYCRNITVAD
jgi:MFS family permease